jgi:hypothetical protein
MTRRSSMYCAFAEEAWEQIEKQVDLDGVHLLPVRYEHPEEWIALAEDAIRHNLIIFGDEEHNGRLYVARFCLIDDIVEDTSNE